jgi:hypothetical protein
MPANRKFTEDEDTEGQSGMLRKAVDEDAAGSSSFGGGARRKVTGDDEDTEGQSGMLRKAVDDDEVGPSGIANRK